MALGIDTIVAEVAVELNIPFVAAIPFVGQEKIWKQYQKDKYNSLLSKATEKVIVSSGGYAAYKMQVRNEWMVKNSDLLIAVYNDKKSGGTFNCLQFAHSENKQTSIIYTKDFKEA